ncbi:MAG TPA: hypothetical protein PLV42_06695 [bacterium]|nr:hypothetical protein [bacterium]
MKMLVGCLLPFFLFSLSVLSCNESPKKEAVTTKRIFDHPTNGLQYLYEVPQHLVPSIETGKYCNDLADYGGGWRMPTISELRWLANEDCPQIQLGDECAVSESCVDYQDCFTFDTCDCSDSPEVDGINSTIINDPEKEWGIFASDTLSYHPAGYEDLWRYWAFSAKWARLLTIESYAKIDVLCVREAKGDDDQILPD